MGRVTQISGVGWKAQLPFKDFRGRGSTCPCQPVSELPPTCLDKGIKREGGRRGGQQKRKSNWCARAGIGFRNYLIPVPAQRLTVGIPVFPRDNGNSLLLIFPPQPHLSASPPSFLPHLSLSPIVYHSKRRDSQHTVHLNMMAGVYSQRNSTTL